MHWMWWAIICIVGILFNLFLFLLAEGMSPTGHPNKLTWKQWVMVCIPFSSILLVIIEIVFSPWLD